MNADGTGLRRVTTEQEPDDFTGISELSPAWSPDGTKIVYVREYNYKDPEDPDHREDHQLYIVNTDGTGQRQLTSLYLAKAGKAGKGFLVQNKGKIVEPDKPSPRKETPAPRKEQSAPTPQKVAAASTRPTPQEIARLRGKVEHATKVGGGVALGMFLVWVLAHRHRFEGNSPLDTGI
jgi:dipeptidyl aminopeptidase/acylaminoacyl peptidase